MSTDPTKPETKYSVYIALVLAGALSMYDLATNGSIEASKEIVLVLVAFAGVRQGIKSFLKK